ncbi:MAG: LptE family protein [Desulfobacterales bacterium]|nr:LptE family protein [Desulfobacterales bacterium]
MRLLTITTWGLIFLMLSACGYRLNGMEQMPEGIQTIAIPIFENRTEETGIQFAFTNDLIFEFTLRGFSVVPDPSSADGVFTGVIRSISVQTISRKGTQTPVDRRVSVTLDLRLHDKAGKKLWSNSIRGNEEYKVGDTSEITGSNKREAILRFSRKIAENIFYGLTADF